MPRDGAPPSAAASESLLEQLRALGLCWVEELRLTRNRRTMVSIRGRTLRLHHAYVQAPLVVHRAVVAFVMARGSARHAARRDIVEWAAQIPPDDRPFRSERTHPDDLSLSEHFALCHGRLNAIQFRGSLGPVAVRVSRRMKTRLGHFSPRRGEVKPEIAISARHVRHHGMADAELTLLHEMVHQWQHESGLPLGHGPAFRDKAREVGIPPRATRKVDSRLEAAGRYC